MYCREESAQLLSPVQFISLSVASEHGGLETGKNLEDMLFSKM